MRSPLDGIGSPFGPSRVPSWVTPGSVWTSDFSNNRYYRKQGGIITADNQLVTTRASGIILPDAAGVYQTLGNNVLPRTDRGLYANGQFTNLVARLNPTVVQCPIRGNVSDAAGFAGFGNSIRFPGGVDAFTYQLPTIANGVPFAASFLVQMEDGNAPVFASASATNAANTFAIVVNGATTWAPPTAYSVTQVAAGIWRVSAIGTTPSTSTSFGIVQYSTNQNRAFRVCGYQLFAGSLVPDALVPGSSDTGGATLFASDIRAVRGIRPSNSQPEPCAGWEAAGLDGWCAGRAIVTIDWLSAATARFIIGAGVDADNLWKVIFDTDNRFKLVVRKSGVDEVTLQTGAVASTGDKTVEWQAKPGDYGIDATGVAGDTDSDAETLPAGTTTLRVGSDFGALNPFNGWIKELQILKVTA